MPIISGISLYAIIAVLRERMATWGSGTADTDVLLAAALCTGY